MVEEKKRSMDPATFFLIAGLIIGILYCIFIPYGAGFDEERHLVRIYYMSQNRFLPTFPNRQIHEDVSDLSYQRRPIQTPAFDMFTREKLSRRFSTFDKLRYGQKTQSLYSPIIFLPQALIGRVLWWKYDFPILPTIILQRIAGMLIYIAGGYTAIRMVPYGKWVFMALALSPATMYQASTLNADGFTTAVSFAFIGWVLAVYAKEGSGVPPRSIWGLVALSVLLGLAKPGAIILLPLLLIILRHPFRSKKWMFLLGAGVFLSILANVGWAALATPGSVYSAGGVQSISRQSSLLITDTGEFLKLLLQGMVLTFPSQVQGWMAAYGYWAGRVPEPVYFFTGIFLVTAFLAEPHSVKIPAKTRIFLAGLFLFCSIAIYAVAFAANYGTGGILALAKHGRYYIPFAPLFFLGCTGLFIVRENVQRQARFIALGSFLLVLGYYSFGIYTTYYTYCGYDAYAGGKCYLPLYKNLEKEDAPEVSIHEGALVSQTFTNQCGELEEVQVFVSTVPEGSTGSLRFSLLDENRRVLAGQDVPIQEIIPEDYLGLPVSIPPETENAVYAIQLESVNLPSTQEIIVLATRSDYYPGQLSQNGIAGRSDLIIHYTCAGP